MKPLIFSTLIALGVSMTSVSLPAAAEQAAEKNVAPDINKSFKSEDLDVRQWAERFTGESRETYTTRFKVADAMGLEPGDRIADIGAGTGIHVQIFSKIVGPTGRVYAVDIAQKFLDFIDENAKREKITNITTVLGADKTSNLPDEAVDVIFHSNTYHHFEYPKTLTEDLARALAPGGEMFVLDFERIPGVTSPRMLEHVRAGKETVIEEIEDAGFTLVEEIDLPELEENYLLRFRKK